MMKRGLILLLIPVIIILKLVSCKKELSCERCQLNNQPPVAIAGPDLLITLPTDSLLLDGSASYDPDGTIINYQWKKIAGPNAPSIINAAVPLAKIKGLIKGDYAFELKVTDDNYLTALDTLKVRVDTSAITTYANPCDNRPIIYATLVPFGTLSAPRLEIQAASAGNKILFIGTDISYLGAANNSLTRVDILDINNNLWTYIDLVNDPFLRLSEGIATSGNKIYVGGGGNFGSAYCTSIINIYDVVNNTWSIENLSIPRESPAGASVNGKVLFAGGTHDYVTDSVVDIFDIQNSTWTVDVLSSPRWGISAISLNNKIFFAGGTYSSVTNDINISNTIDIYDGLSNTWSVSTLREKRTGMATIASGNKIYWAGGATNTNGTSNIPSGTVEIRDINTGLDTLVCILPRQSFGAVQKNDNLIFFTGFGPDTRNGTYFEIFNISTNTWYTAILDKKIQGAAIISVNNTVYVAGGAVNGVVSDKVWKLEF